MTEPAAAGTGRIEAFSDGVFAIAITLLVLDLKVPPLAGPTDPTGLFPRLLAEWPGYLGYALSFVVVGIMWANHHNIFRYIERSDHTFVLLNLLFLLFISFLPFPTAVLARYLTVPHDRTAATALYAGTLLANGVTYNALWRYAAHRGRLLGPDADPVQVQRISRQFLVGPVLYAAATVLAFVSVPASLTIVGLLAVFYVVPNASRR
jgi:TMEM175 potassium channel family protein